MAMTAQSPHPPNATANPELTFTSTSSSRKKMVTYGYGRKGPHGPRLKSKPALNYRALPADLPTPSSVLPTSEGVSVDDDNHDNDHHAVGDVGRQMVDDAMEEEGDMLDVGTMQDEENLEDEDTQNDIDMQEDEEEGLSEHRPYSNSAELEEDYKEDEFLPEGWYKVQNILAHRDTGKNREYLVHWQNFDLVADLTWEPETNLRPAASENVDEYLRSLPSSKRLGLNPISSQPSKKSISKVNKKRGRGRPRKKDSTLNQSSKD